MKFNVGDKVVVTDVYQGMDLVGAKAEVVRIDEGDCYGLDIDGWNYGHDCDVLGDGARSGWWVPSRCFKKASVFKGNK